MTYVFDLDGTLIDSTRRHWVLMESILNDHGIKVDNNFADDYMSYKASGNGGKDYLKNILNIDNELASTIQKEWISRIEDESMLELDELYDDALPTLSKIKEPILFLTIRENAEGLKKSLIRLGLNDYEVKILPHGESKANVLKEISDQVIMIGDTEIDYKAAIETGCNYYLLNRGFRNEDYWNELGIRSYKDLSELAVN